MDFQKVFNDLSANFDAFAEGKISEEVMDRYIKGVFDTLTSLGLMESYLTWCEEHGIIKSEEEY